MSGFLDTAGGRLWLELAVDQLMQGQSVEVCAGHQRAGVDARTFLLEVDLAFADRPDEGFEVVRARIAGRLPESLIEQDQATARETATRMLERLATLAEQAWREYLEDARGEDLFEIWKDQHRR